MRSYILMFYSLTCNLYLIFFVLLILFASVPCLVSNVVRVSRLLFLIAPSLFTNTCINNVQIVSVIFLKITYDFFLINMESTGPFFISVKRPSDCSDLDKNTCRVEYTRYIRRQPLALKLTVRWRKMVVDGR